MSLYVHMYCVCTASLIAMGLGTVITEDTPMSLADVVMSNPTLLTAATPGGLLQPAGATGMLSKVVLCTNMVTASELQDDEDYEDIVLDIEEECGKAGQLLQVTIPRHLADTSGNGRVFLKYAEYAGATAAIAMLNGRKFGGRTVVATYYDEPTLDSGNYSAI